MVMRFNARLRFASVLSLLGLVAACIAGGSREPRPGVDSRKDYTICRDIIYTPQNWPAPVLGDLYRPKNAVSAPGVLLIHGGGWTGKDGRWQMDSIAKQLAKRGYVVLNVTYRLAPRWTYPAPVEDLQQAVKWMRNNGTEYGIDPNRIATFGYSAGGYLAALTGLIEGPADSKIRAIVAGGAPSNLTFYPGGDLVPQFLGGTQQQIPQRFKEASPVNYVTSKSPPMFVYHSTDDKLVPREHADAMIAELRKNSVSHESFWIRGRDHIATFLFPGGSIDAAIAFLDRRMKSPE